MSLFGKVLALLNIFGAAGLIYFAAVDYGKRTAWTESALRHELVLRGLPLSDKEPDKQHQPRVRQLEPAMLNELFREVGGAPVKTQHEEVTRLRGDLDAKIAAAAGQDKDKPRGFERQTYALARILRPLVNAMVDRDQVDAALFYFADTKRADELRARHSKAFTDAMNRPEELEKVKPPLAFEQSFQLALRVQGGQPSTGFSNIVARLLPATAEEAKKVKFNQVYDKALGDQFKALEVHYDELFGTAMGTPRPGDPGQQPPSPEIQKDAVARLLFGLALYQAEEVVTSKERPAEDEELLKGLQPGTAAFAAKLPETTTFDRQVRRVMVITGPRALTDAVMRRTAALQEMATDVRASATSEMLQFVSDNATLVRQLRVLADVLQDEERRLKELLGLEKTQATLVSSQGTAVQDRQADLRESIKQTKELYEAVKARSAELLKNRQAIQQRIRDTEQGEEHVRYLEKLARDLESEKK